ncbi:xylitol dehydrogenase [Sanghuangporus baumii]|uniref:Xylitol dehydrogenase n=1 Tax=Sanghuangporus baumii TaxID=108892 RepID=A0A9Q5HTY3_SANBA|nr:xylitol dehydrogenase [Sanghuangporus baumii]
MLENTAFILNSPLDATFGPNPIPDLAPDEVLVEVKKTGICGSDATELQWNRFATAVSVMSARAEITRYRQLCERLTIASVCPVDGTLQRYFSYPFDTLYKLPDHLTLEDGAMLEPLSVAVHAVSYVGQFRHGRNILVFGAGPIGLLCMAVARALGAMEIVAVDIIASRLEFAKQYAATETFLPPPKGKDEKNMDYSKRVVELMKNTIGFKERGSKSFDLVVDATGVETCIQMAFLAVKMGGTFVEVGIGPEEIQVPVTTLITKEFKATGALVYGPGDYRLSLALASSGKVDLKPLVTHRFKFEDAITAFEVTRAGKSVDGKGQTKNVIKTIISGPDVDPADI